MEVNIHEIFREIYSMESYLINLNFKNPLGFIKYVSLDFLYPFNYCFQIYIKISKTYSEDC